MKLIKGQNKLVSEILELVKLNGGVPLQGMEPVNIRHCVESALEPLSPLMESKGQALAMDVDDDIACVLDGRLFSKVLSNVLANAAQNSPCGAEIRIGATNGPERVRLTVWNGGVEIPEGMLPSLCEPFYRADEARTSGEGRSGLGLAIVKKALDLMQVGFTIRNEDGGVLFQMDIESD